MTDAMPTQHAVVDQTFLTPLVRQVLQDERAIITDWCEQPIDDGFSGSAVHRFTGEVQTAQGLRSWSLIRKAVSPANGSAEPTAYGYWQREVLLYQSGLLNGLPPESIAPRCLLIQEIAAQHYWLWLEDMGSQELTTQWPLADYGVAARHLGQFNGAYLVGRPLPTQERLRQPDVRERLAAAAAGISELPTLRTNPHFAQLLGGNRVDRIQRLWAERERLLARLDQLPQTFCHRDAFHRNLLRRPDSQGRMQTVLLDWGSCGVGILGEELVPLFSATLTFTVADTSRLAELDEVIFHGYIAGLRDAGWQGDEQLVRFGFTALTALKVAVADPAIKMPKVARRIAALPPGAEVPRLLNPGGYEQAVVVSDYELGLGEEAVSLLSEL